MKLLRQSWKVSMDTKHQRISHISIFESSSVSLATFSTASTITSRSTDAGRNQTTAGTVAKCLPHTRARTSAAIAGRLISVAIAAVAVTQISGTQAGGRKKKKRYEANCQ